MAGRQNSHVILGLLLLVAGPVRPLTFSSNGYEDLLVAVGDGVPENLDIIEQIKLLFTNASAYLHTATRQRAYFRSVTILVPSSWSAQAGWGASQGQTLATAQVRVDSASPLYGDTPYTFQPAQCGQPGHFIHLTPKFVSDPAWRHATFGDGGRLLVHEFAHLRYGVFDEYGFGSDLYPNFYVNDQRHVKPTGCTAGMTGSFLNRYTGGACKVDSNTALPVKDCVFLPDLTSNTARASIMFQQAVASVEQFCEQTLDPALRHDRHAPSHHNRMCAGRATYAVIAEHEDFKNGNPGVSVPDTSPAFSVLQHRAPTSCGRRGILVLDVSGSMTTNDRLLRQRQTAATVIDALPEGSRLGLVSFSSSASTLQGFRNISDDADRTFLKSRLPTLATGSTAIGLALQKSLQMLQADGGASYEDHVFLTTDGEENVDPRVATVLPSLKSSGVHFHTLGYSSSSSLVLTTLSSETGGEYFYFEEDVNSTALSALASAISNLMNRCDRELRVQVDREAFPDLAVGAVQERGVLLDSSIGRQLTFTFVLSRDLSMQVKVISPNGTLYDYRSPEYRFDSSLNIIYVTIPVAQRGQWRYEVENTGTQPGLMVSSVQAKALVGKVPVDVTSWMGLDLSGSAYVVYAYVHRGYDPVLCADVNASISRPNDSPIVIPLLDNGRAVDAMENDGVYSGAYVPHGGRTGLDILVQSKSCTVLLTAATGATGAQPVVPLPAPNTTTEAVPDLSRELMGREDDINATEPGPPGAVIDLRPAALDQVKRHVTLTWTAPGAHGAAGTVARTELRMSGSYEKLESNFSNSHLVTDSLLLSGSLAPLPAGQHHQVSLNLSQPAPWDSNTFVFGLQTANSQGQTSPLSNFVVVTFDPVTYPQNVGPGVVRDSNVTDPNVTKTDQEVNVGAVVGGIVGGLLGFALVVSLAALLVAKLQAKKRPESHEVSPFSDMHRTDVAPARFQSAPPANTVQYV